MNAKKISSGTVIFVISKERSSLVIHCLVAVKGRNYQDGGIGDTTEIG